MTFGIACAEKTEIIILFQIRDKIGRVPEIILCGYIGVRVPSKGKNVFYAFVFENMGKLVDLTPVIMAFIFLKQI